MARFAYIDESGTGKMAKEPHVVMAGVIVHADRDWMKVEARLKELAVFYTGDSKSSACVFHATDIFGGAGIWPRHRYSRADRMAILLDLAKIPGEFGLPVVNGFVDRKQVADIMPGTSLHDQTLFAQVGAALRCTVSVERFMRSGAADGEVATLVYENNDTARKMIRELHNDLKNPSGNMLDVLPQWKMREFVPLTRIVDTAHFADKKDTSILQLADLCAFVIRRFLAGGGDIGDLCAALEPQMRHAGGLRFSAL